MDNFEPCAAVDDFHSVLTIQLCELIDAEVFTWDNKHLKNAFADLGADNAARLQSMFTERFHWREISIVPPGQWMQRVGYTIKYELVPKYKPLYDALANGDFSPFNEENEFYKARNIDSDFPETLLSQNQVYASFGTDREYQRIKTANGLDVATRFSEYYRNVDTMLIDDLKVFFTDLWTLNYNGM